jgi:glutamyl-tRNA synthetase
MLETAASKLNDCDFSVEGLTNALNQLLEETGQKPGILFSLIRVATTWAPFSPALADSLSVLGKDIALGRIEKSIAAIA